MHSSLKIQWRIFDIREIHLLDFRSEITESDLADAEFANRPRVFGAFVFIAAYR